MFHQFLVKILQSALAYSDQFRTAVRLIRPQMLVEPYCRETVYVGRKDGSKQLQRVREKSELKEKEKGLDPAVVEKLRKLKVVVGGKKKHARDPDKRRREQFCPCSETPPVPLAERNPGNALTGTDPRPRTLEIKLKGIHNHSEDHTGERNLTVFFCDFLMALIN